MEFALFVYIAAFVLLTACAIHVENALGLPRWKVASATVAAGLGAAGMILYAREAVTPLLSDCWKVVFPLLVAHAVLDGALDLRYGLARRYAMEFEEGGAALPTRRQVAASFAAGVLALAPYVYINFRVAFPAAS